MALTNIEFHPLYIDYCVIVHIDISNIESVETVFLWQFEERLLMSASGYLILVLATLCLLPKIIKILYICVTTFVMTQSFSNSKLVFDLLKTPYSWDLNWRSLITHGTRAHESSALATELLAVAYLAKHMDRKQTLNRPVSVRNIELYCIGFCQQEISSSILGGTGNTPTYFWIVWHPLGTSWITRLHLDNFRRINNNCRIDTPTN